MRFTQFVFSTFLVIANLWFALALSRIDKSSWNMYHIKAEYFLFWNFVRWLPEQMVSTTQELDLLWIPSWRKSLHPGKLSLGLAYSQPASFISRDTCQSSCTGYAQTETSDDASKDQFYDDLSVSVALNHTSRSRHDVTIVMGDLNASIGSDRIAHRSIIGPVCSGFANDNGSRLLDFCSSNDLRLGSS